MLASIDPTGPEVERVERAIRYLARNRLEQPRLEEVADVMGLSPSTRNASSPASWA